MNKSWKEHFLSSGVPLEHSVAETVRSLDLSGPRKFKYERPNELGIPTVFSVDIHASRVDIGSSPIWIDFFIECKYRHDSVSWIFTPEEQSYHNFEFGVEKLYNVLDDFSDGLILNPSLPFEHDSHPLCNRGIEITEKGPNPKAIDQAIQQLAYAVADQTAEAIEHQARHLIGSPSPVWLLVPIVVTTATLWRMRAGQTLDMIRKATDVSEIADLTPLVVLHEEPDNQLRQFTRTRLKSRFPKEEQRSLSLKLKEFHRYDFNSFCDIRATHHPSYYIICDYTHLKEALQTILNTFSSAEAVSLRKKEK